MSFPLYIARAKRNTTIGPTLGSPITIPKGSIGTIQIISPNYSPGPTTVGGHRSLVRFKFNGLSFDSTVSTDSINPNIYWMFFPKAGGGGDNDFELVTTRNLSYSVDKNNSNFSDTTSDTTTESVVEKPSLLKTALAFAITLLFLFVLFYVASRAWKKGQETN